jgi:predicted enzyme related to lactoylglutathione lyase
MEQKHGGSSFCHIVIPAPDLAKAKSFYEAVFGWHVRPNVPGPTYWFFDSGNVGGAFESNRKPGLRSVVLVLKVDDMQTTIDLITQHGGTVTQGRSQIGEAAPGYDAYFLDPNGNEMGLHSDR